MLHALNLPSHSSVPSTCKRIAHKAGFSSTPNLAPLTWVQAETEAKSRGFISIVQAPRAQSWPWGPPPSKKHDVERSVTDGSAIITEHAVLEPNLANPTEFHLSQGRQQPAEATPVRSATRDAAGNATSGLAEGNANRPAAAGSRVIVGSAGIGARSESVQSGSDQSESVQSGSAEAVGNNGVGGVRRRKKKQAASEKQATTDSGADYVTSVESPNNGRKISTASDVNQRLISSAASQPLDDSASASQPLDVSDPRVWLPPPPDVPRPRATHNAAMLAYIGDGIYELYARRHFLNPPSAIATYCQRVTAVVCCEAQDALLRRLINTKTLTEDERDVVRWGRNASTGARKAKGRAGSTVYANATALETLIGFLYLTNPSRLEHLMNGLGFVCDASDLRLPSHGKS
ncbi:hypothetical protein CLOM_g15594 [Closterium sp. NIES-68]|nr:hypothetical protein CLOM_g15594 [Closterium sp. NIES-68]GJP79564.1 hypothetical protein CLOP_g9785 [Closterium sp. NIES-67]